MTSIIGAVAGAAGGIFNAVGSYQDAISRAAMLRQQASQSKKNVELVEKDRGLVAEASAQERAAISKDSAQIRAANMAQFASGNVLTGEGSALDVDVAEAERAASSRARSKMEEITSLQKLDIEKTGLLKEARAQRKAAKRAKRAGTAKLIGGILGAS